MFFSIEKQINPTFTNHYEFDHWVINTDAGWTLNHHTLFKGIEQNYCRFVIDQDVIHLEHPLYRTFPLFINDGQISNMIVGEKIAADFKISINYDLTVNKQQVDIIGDFAVDTLSEEEILDTVYNIIDNSVRTFIETNTLPLYIFLSGGIDTALCFSFIQKYTDDFTLLPPHYVNSSEFWDKNDPYIKNNHWAYDQIHLLDHPSVLVSGCPGDEYTLRCPKFANLYLMYQHSNILDELKKVEHCLHKNYFLLKSNVDHYRFHSNDTRTKLLVKNKKFLYKHMINVNLNDFQHWHIDNTLTFCPLRDISIFKQILRLPHESIMGQILNAEISKKLIERNNPKLLKILDKDKNPPITFDKKLFSKYTKEDLQP